ncbi:MAG: GntR family transcriptional regulator [Streptosporangiaceae bacterium]|nr:GntR family transcriptional regulator [Streptosporangiaceae bacterium]
MTEGALAPGMPTPSITTLSQRYGHARQTCAKALRMLEDEGLLTRIPGLGYYVTDDAPARIAAQSGDADDAS